ncbi:MAG: rubrerythrin [Firmicutes bacterium]|nr:rubrerythrin [Bacillota bacterium]
MKGSKPMADTEKQNYHDRYYPGENRDKTNNNLTTLELLRINLIGELEAINQYEQHARMTTNPEASMLFQEIANDEKHHVAELIHLIMDLDAKQREEMLREMERRRPGM